MPWFNLLIRRRPATPRLIYHRRRASRKLNGLAAEFFLTALKSTVAHPYFSRFETHLLDIPRLDSENWWIVYECISVSSHTYVHKMTRVAKTKIVRVRRTLRQQSGIHCIFPFAKTNYCLAWKLRGYYLYGNAISACESLPFVGRIIWKEPRTCA